MVSRGEQFHLMGTDSMNILGCVAVLKGVAYSEPINHNVMIGREVMAPILSKWR